MLLRSGLCVLTVLVALTLPVGAFAQEEGFSLDQAAQIEQAQDDIAGLTEKLNRARNQLNFEKTHGWLSLPQTKLGYAFRWHQPNAENLSRQTYGGVNFDTNVGISWLLSPAKDLSVARSLAWGVNLLYSGSYDFRMDLRSGPVLSRLQNPQVSMFIDEVGTRGSVAWSWTFGWAHESNGQFAETKADFAKLASIDEFYNDQFFASMGWDYYFARFTRYFRFPAFSIMPHLEVRHLLRQSRWNPLQVDNLEDSANITGLPIRAPGIRAYDGLRIGSLFTTGAGSHVTLDFILPTLWALEAPLNLMQQTGLEATITFDKPLTWYVQAKLGTRVEPAYYFAREAALGVGLSIQGLDFWPK